MKIYTKIVIDMVTDDIIEEESYEYDGQLSLCNFSGGGGQTSTTTSTPLTKKQYDPLGYAAREKLMPKMEAKYDVGLTDEEKSYYRGLGIGEVEDAYGAGTKVMNENLARAGIGPGDGARAESIADLLKQKLMARAGVGQGLIGKDIGMKQMNLQNLMSLIADSGAVGTAGSQTTTEGGGGSVMGGTIKGALGGGLGGLGLTAIPALSGYGLPLALGGAVLGGLGGLFS